MDEFRNDVQDLLDRVGPTDVLDVLIIAIVVFWVLVVLLRGTAAIALLRGAAIILVGAVILAESLNLEVLDFVLRNSVTGLIIAVPIIFQPEIRRALERVGRTGFSAWARPTYDEVIDTVTAAVLSLARQKHGALIVFERETGLQDHMETGVRVDAQPSVALLQGIFFPNSPLHDGAVILRANKVIAAACTLPVSETRPRADLGLRHKAGLGITEGTDAVSVIVSEETGSIAVAADGRLYARLDEPRLRDLLARLMGSEAVRSGGRG